MRTYKVISNPIIDADGHANAKHGEASKIALAEFEDMLTVFTKCCPLLDVDILFDTHAADHDK